MDYFKFQIFTGPATAEILMALLAAHPFDTFQETEYGVDAYIPISGLSNEVVDYLGELKNRYDFTFQQEFIQGQNWNEIWETNFHPVILGEFCGIRASFHPPFSGVRFDLIINPKMAFGTGHHETTSMVVELMEKLHFSDAKVLDYGCGTGILAILASKLGAAHIDAVDIEEESFLNTIENCEVNNVANVRAIQGTLANVPGHHYDIILANINRNVILDSLTTLCQVLKPGGLLILSGFIRADEELMQNALASVQCDLLQTKRKNDWLSMVAKWG